MRRYGWNFYTFSFLCRYKICISYSNAFTSYHYQQIIYRLWLSLHYEIMTIHYRLTYNSLRIGKPIVIRNCWSPMIMFMIYRLKIYPCFWHKVVYLKPVILVKWPHSKELMLSIYLLSLGANLSTRYSLWWTHSSGEDEGRLLFVVWSSFPIINLTRLLMQ